MKSIGILFKPEQSWLREVFLGISEWAEHQDWVFEFGTHQNPYLIEETPHLDGIITDRPIEGDLNALQGIPTVYLGPNLTPCVQEDFILSGRMCARHLLERGYRHLAVFHHRNEHLLPPLLRLQGFREEGEKAGCFVEVFRIGRRTRKKGAWTLEDQHRDLADFLRDLPKPLGVMAANVDYSKRLHSVCRKEGFRIPEELALISPSDEPLIFNNTRPGISAIVPDQRKEGREAAKALAGLMQGEVIPERTLIPPFDLNVRGSTDHRIMQDPMCETVVKYIWSHLDESPSREDLAKLVHVTPRTLHRHFTQEVGRTPTEEMLYARIETAKRLLATTSIPLVEIALQCGYSSQSAFNRHFRKAVDSTPLEWRARFQ